METLFERIKRHERFCQYPKPDHQFKGNSYVIGYGCDISEQEAKTIYRDGISQAEAITLLNDRLNEIEDKLFDAIPWLLHEADEIRCDIIVEMAFQMGVQGVLGFHDMLDALREKNYAEAAKEMINSVWHRETTSRCEELANLMLNGG